MTLTTVVARLSCFYWKAFIKGRNLWKRGFVSKETNVPELQNSCPYNMDIRVNSLLIGCPHWLYNCVNEPITISRKEWGGFFLAVSAQCLSCLWVGKWYHFLWCTVSWCMEFFSWRWRLISAKLSIKFAYCPSCTVSIVFLFHEHNSLPLGQMQAFMSC